MKTTNFIIFVKGNANEKYKRFGMVPMYQQALEAAKRIEDSGRIVRIIRAGQVRYQTNEK